MVDVLDCLHLRLDGRVFGIRLLVSSRKCFFFLSLSRAAAAAAIVVIIVVVAARVYFCIRSERDQTNRSLFSRAFAMHPSDASRTREGEDPILFWKLFWQRGTEREKVAFLSLFLSLSLFFLAKRKEGRSRFFSSPSSKACRKICIADLIILLFDSITR